MSGARWRWRTPWGWSMTSEPKSVSRLSRVEKVERLFRAFPDTWINEEEFIPLGGRCGFTARIRDCRKAPRGMHIENRVIRHPWGVRSQYRFVTSPQERVA